MQKLNIEMVYDCIIVGGGAAGCFAAANLLELKPDAKVLILEKSSKLLSKVKISGGGRCNVTHRFTDIDSFASNYPRGERFMRRVLHHFSPSDTIKWFESRGVKLKTESDGRIFPVSDQSQDIINCLMKAMKGAEIKYHQQTVDIDFDVSLKLVKTLDHSYSAKNVILACGGGVGKSPFLFLDSINLKIAPLVPSLFSFNIKPHPFKDLMGISVPLIKIKIAGTKLIGQGSAVITHWGLSGPAILRLSAFGAYEMAERNYKFTIILNWLPELSDQEIIEVLEKHKRQHPQKHLVSRPFSQFSERLWLRFIEMCGLSQDFKWASLGEGSIKKLSRTLASMEVNIDGKTTYKEEFVTAGGIELSEIVHTTCELKKYSGIYMAGEMLNSDGVTGGFNFQHAWSTAYLSACAVAQNLK
ncbi:MAG: aminoacetone oxidase family FAD-binding enzyme [Flavobacteriales bacterium]